MADLWPLPLPLPLCSGAPELRVGDLPGGALCPGPGAGVPGDGGHLARHAGPGGLGGAPGPAETLRLPRLALLTLLTLLLQPAQVRDGKRTRSWDPIFRITSCHVGIEICLWEPIAPCWWILQLQLLKRALQVSWCTAAGVRDTFRTEQRHQGLLLQFWRL